MDIFRDGDVCSLGFLIAVLFAIGSKMVERRADLYQWGLRLAVAAFLLYVILGAVETHARDANDYATLAFRGLFAAGLTLGIAWIVLSILAFLHHHLIERPGEGVRRWREEARRQRLEREARREADRKAARERAEWERAAPERERQRQQAEAEARARAEAQRRREDARAGALLDYTYYAAKLGSRFSRADFDHYLQTYMGDVHPPEIVERRRQELVAIFERHLADVSPPRKEMTIDGLTGWYETTKARIEGSSMDDRTKRTQLAELYARYTELMSELMERMRP